MQAVLQQAQAWAETTSPLLLRGEQGSGRCFLARYIHSVSPRSHGPFVVAHCSALPESVAESALFGHERGALSGAETQHIGLLEEADGGSVLLDGVSELSPPLQVKLLRALQEGRFYRVGGTRPVRVDLRVLAGTRRDLPTLVADGRFRQDLYETLSALRLDLPPLRRRLADIEPLAQAFVADFNARNGTRLKGLTPEAVGLIETHDWPGNLRELRATIDRLLVGTRSAWVEARPVEEELATHPTSSSYGTDTDIAQLLREREHRWLSAAMDRAGGHRGRAARMLNLRTEELERLLALHAVDDFGR